MRNEISRWRLRRPWLPCAITLGMLALPAVAQPEPPAAETAPQVEDLLEPAARAAVKRMVEALAGAQRFSYEYESSYDAVQDDGEILEFGSRGTSTIRRPDRARGEVWHRDGRHVLWAGDGTEVAVIDETKNVYATTPRTGDLDSLVDFLREDVGMKLPVADLFKSNLATLLVDNVLAARHVGQERIDDVEVDHVAMRMRSGIDVQLWIQTGEHALPARLVLNFATADGRPQFRADFHDWDLDPRARDSYFELDAPKGAKVVPFVLPTKRTAQSATEESVQ